MYACGRCGNTLASCNSKRTAEITKGKLTDFFYFEDHSTQSDAAIHGDVCRVSSTNTAWQCPPGCIKLGVAPWCGTSGSTTKPCRSSSNGKYYQKVLPSEASINIWTYKKVTTNIEPASNIMNNLHQSMNFPPNYVDGSSRYSYNNRDEALNGCKLNGFKRLCSKTEGAGFSNCQAGYYSDAVGFYHDG